MKNFLEYFKWFMILYFSLLIIVGLSIFAWIYPKICGYGAGIISATALAFYSTINKLRKSNDIGEAGGIYKDYVGKNLPTLK